MNYLNSAGSNISSFSSATQRSLRRHPGVGYLEATAAIAAVGPYLSVTRNRAPSIQTDSAAVQAAASDLIKFYDGLSLLDIQKPEFVGTDIDRAQQIRAWMNKGGGGNAAILHCTTLDLSAKQLTKLPPEIRLFRNLQILNLSDNELTVLPPEIGHLVQLRELNLSSNLLVALPPTIGTLIQLTTLNLLNNQLKALPPEIGYLVQLRELNLASNQLVILPSEMSNLVQLKELNLSDNRLATLPSWIGNLIQLTKLHCVANRLTRLLPEIGNLVQLTELDLSHNELTALPSEIGNLVQLTTLSLAYNELTVLPPEIGNLVQLIELYLSHNELTALPPEISLLVQLTGLHLSSNQLTVLPPEIGHLVQLRRVFILNNQLGALPDRVFHLSRDCVIEAESNRFNPLFIQSFQQRLLAHRANHQDQGPTVRVTIHDNRGGDQEMTLDERLQEWSREFETHFPRGEENRELWENRATDFTPLTAITGDNKNNLNVFLRRIRTMPDYDHPRTTQAAQNNVICKTERMIQLAIKNPLFREKMLAIIAEGLTTCGDRVLRTFEAIDIQWQFDHTELTEEAFKALARRVNRHDLLIQHAEAKARELGLGDSTETILDYQIQLREILNLPITTERMLYQGMSGVTEEMLTEAEAIIKSYDSYDEILLCSKYWQERQRKLHAAQAEKVHETYANLQQATLDYFDLPMNERAQFLEKHPQLCQFVESSGNVQQASLAVMASWNAATARLGRTEEEISVSN